MKVLFFSAVLLFVSFIVLLIFWRISINNRAPWRIIVVFGTVPLIWICIVLYFSNQFAQSSLIRISLWETLQILLFFGSASITFFIFYTSIIDPSPTLAIIRRLMKSEEGGLDREAFSDFFRDEILVLKRLDSMVQTGMVIKDEIGYSIAPKGRNFIKLFVQLPHCVFPINQTNKAE